MCRDGRGGKLGWGRVSTRTSRRWVSRTAVACGADFIPAPWLQSQWLSEHAGCYRPATGGLLHFPTSRARLRGLGEHGHRPTDTSTGVNVTSSPATSTAVRSVLLRPRIVGLLGVPVG
jgi:hypothetical protein